MKQKLPELVVVISLALFLSLGCETDQAVTGVRVISGIPNNIVSVKILPDSAEPDFDSAPELLTSSPIANGDSRDFETPVGVFDVQVMDTQEVAYDETLTVIDGQVASWTVLLHIWGD